MSDVLPPLPKPELFFALVAPIGVDLSVATKVFEKKLSIFNYTTKDVRVSSTFDQFATTTFVDESSTYNRYMSAMTVGNEIRNNFDLPGILALAAISKIFRFRQAELTHFEQPYLENTCYIINQLKRPEEIEILRRNYGSHLFVFAITSPLRARVQYLSEKIRKDDSSRKSRTSYEPQALQLINRDEEEEDNKFGQRLRLAFSKADFFVEGSSFAEFEQGIERAVDLIFGKSFISPRPDEFFMNIASNVALQSADLSRQVGAVIVNKSNEIVSYGCNEVPRAGGGVYWDGDKEDFRDHTLDSDPNVDHKNRLIQDLLRIIKPTMKDTYQKMNPAEILEYILENNEINIEEAQINDLLEFGRVVHAEMNALTQAAKSGRSTEDATLYCTTFPCHVCARHVIAAGIGRVVFVEPYSKSQALEQYPEAIKIEGRETQTNKVVEFQRFSGVSPIRFTNFFSHGRRKTKKGKAIKWRLGEPIPICENHFPTYLQNELASIKYLAGKIGKGEGPN